MIPATKMYPIPVRSVSVYTNGAVVDTISHRPFLGLNELFDKAASLKKEPVPLAVYELIHPLPPIPAVFAAAIAIQDEEGIVIAAWHSEPMFRSIHAALDHANDMLGCELFPLICDCDGWANETL